MPAPDPKADLLRYLQLAHNVWDSQKRRSAVQVVYNFGREDAANREALQRLAASVTRFLDPGAALAASAAGAGPLEALETRLTLGVDLASVEGFAFVLLAEDFVGSIDLGKARSRLGVVLVGVRMQLFCEPAVGALDLARARLAIYAQDLIGITHPQATPRYYFGPAPAPPRLATSMWESKARPAM